MPLSQRWPYLIGAVIAVLLQIIVAPNIRVLDAVPNFILCYVIACAVANPRGVGYIMPFVLGLVYNLAGQGPIGSMSLICMLAVFFSTFALKALEIDTIVFPIITIAIVAFCSELAYGLLLMACGLNVSFLEALLHICLPCGLYDTVLALIAFPFARRFVFGGKKQSEMSIIDSGLD